MPRTAKRTRPDGSEGDKGSPGERHRARAELLSDRVAALKDTDGNVDIYVAAHRVQCGMYGDGEHAVRRASEAVGISKKAMEKVRTIDKRWKHRR